MSDSLTSILKVQSLVDSAVVLKLLRSRNLPLIISFLYQEFKTNEQLSVPTDLLIQRLADYLELINYQDSDEDQFMEVAFQPYDIKARQYINGWMELGYLRNIMDDERKEPVVFLTKHMEKAFQVFELIQEREFVGTESKFKDIFTKLREIIEKANPDKEKRLEELQKKKRAIEEEIQRIEEDGFVSTLEDYQIKSRYQEVSRMSSELVGDFKEVEENFQNITRRIYERQQQESLTKGKLLEETFDALGELRATDQGKSFYAFWQFILSETSQNEFQNLTREVYQVLEERGIEVSSRPLRKLKTILFLAARKVLDKNGVLADKLSREIVAKDQLESRKTRELISSIKKLAIQQVRNEEVTTAYLEFHGDPLVYLPLERRLGEKQEKRSYSTHAGKAAVSIEDLEDVSRIFSGELIDKQKLLNNIRIMLTRQNQVSLSEVVQANPLNEKNGLAELLAYVSLVNSSSKFFINDTTREVILFNPVAGKYLDLPQILFTR